MIGRMVRLMAGAGLLLGALAVASPAQADSVWFQSVARASASAPCPDDSFGTPWQSNWDPAQRSWRPSWAQWPNAGTGGFTCDRQITWAKNGYPSAGCVTVETTWVDFRGGWYLPSATRYADSGCTTPTGLPIANIVYAPSGWSGPALCTEAFGAAVTTPFRYSNSDVWTCSTAG